MVWCTDFRIQKGDDIRKRFLDSRLQVLCYSTRELQLNPARPISWWSEDRCRSLLLVVYMWASRKNKQLHNNGGISRDYLKTGTNAWVRWEKFAGWTLVSSAGCHVLSLFRRDGIQPKYTTVLHASEVVWLKLILCPLEESRIKGMQGTKIPFKCCRFLCKCNYKTECLKTKATAILYIYMHCCEWFMEAKHVQANRPVIARPPSEWRGAVGYLIYPYWITKAVS